MLNKDKVTLGIAPIGWSNDDMPSLGAENTFKQILSEVALAGFTKTEVGRTYPKDAKEVRAELDLRGLTIASRWFSSFLATESYESNETRFIEFLDYLEIVGAKCINVSEQSHSIQGDENAPVFDMKPTMSEEEWPIFCEGLSKLSKVAKDRGFRLCFHHHMGTVVQTIEETERMLNNTDDTVFLCYDTGHFVFSGEDPFYIANKYPNRIGHVHLKDVRLDTHKRAIDEKWSFMKSVREGTFTVPGDGSIDFPKLFEILEKNDYEGCMLVEAEQDPAKANPLKYAQMARAYIKEKTGI